MTPLPSRLRASAQAMRGLFLVSENVPNVRMIYKEDRDRIAAELSEAADALEAGQDPRDMQFNRFLAFANQDGQDTAHAFDTERSRWHFFNPMTADLWRYWLAAAQVAQEGASGVATDTPAVCRLCLAVTGGRQCFEPACPGGVATGGGGGV